ncbi:hypothetical protein [Tsuneonella aeria]|nr:hypothetical protein [Tsuneonella aeria]
MFLIAPFAAIAVASLLTIADAAVRGWNAARNLRADADRQDSLRQIVVRFEDQVQMARMPALRPATVNAGRRQRQGARSPERLRAVA